MSEDLYVLDCEGDRIYAGDYIQCVCGYPSLKRGEYRYVQEIRPYDCVSLNNTQSPYGKSDYKAYRFKQAGRYHAWHKGHMPQLLQEKHIMLHIAVRLNESSMGTFVEQIHKFGMQVPGNLIGSGAPAMLVNTSADALKGEIRGRIQKCPGERWLILSGNTIGEIAESPVRFRSV